MKLDVLIKIYIFLNHLIVSDLPLSLGKQEAFEMFKRDYPQTTHILDQKELLKQRYSEAKALGQEVNEARNEISKTIK